VTFEGDLAGAEFWGADLRGATFRDVDLTGVRISHARVVDVVVDAEVDRLVVNGVDVTDYVNARDRWHPVRSMLRPVDPDGLRAAWAALRREWAALVADADRLGPGAWTVSVAGEWSLQDTLRHLVFAIDKWCTVPILGGRFAPLGVPNTGSQGYPFPGVDLAVTPTLDATRAVFDAAVAEVTGLVATLPAVPDRAVEVHENGVVPWIECLHTVLEEAFWHLRYARRDLEFVAATGPEGSS
jgi:hypothetical protein